MEPAKLVLDYPTTKSDKDCNRMRPEDQPVHRWYRFVLSFPAHLVRDYIRRFSIHSNSLVLDPFCGTGTTLVECKKNGIRSVGIEANPMAWFATRVKTNWRVDPDALLEHASVVATKAASKLESEGYGDHVDAPLFRRVRANHDNLLSLPEEQSRLLLRNSISRVPLHKVLVLLEILKNNQREEFADHERLALANALVTEIGNLEFGPEVGVGPQKSDAPVLSAWLKAVEAMASDLRAARLKPTCESAVYHGDSRVLSTIVGPKSVDAVITSPPYPNEKDYTRTTRLESVLLGFLQTKAELRGMKTMLIRSNTRCVYKNDVDDQLVAQHAGIRRIAETIEARRIELGKRPMVLPVILEV